MLICRNSEAALVRERLGTSGLARCSRMMLWYLPNESQYWESLYCFLRSKTVCAMKVPALLVSHNFIVLLSFPQ